MKVRANLKKPIVPDAERLSALQKELQSVDTEKQLIQRKLGAALLDEGPAMADLKIQYAAALDKQGDLLLAIETIQERLNAAAHRRRTDAKAAQSDVLRASLRSLESDAKALNHDFETLSQHTRALMASLNGALEAANAIGDEELHAKLTTARAKFRFYLLHAASAMPGCAVPYVENLPKYSEQFPKASSYRPRRSKKRGAL